MLIDDPVYDENPLIMSGQPQLSNTVFIRLTVLGAS